MNDWRSPASLPILHAAGRRGPRPRGSARARALAILGLVLAAGVVAVVALLLLSSRPSASTLARRYARAWARGDYGQLYAELDASSRARLSPAQLAALERRYAALATVLSARVGAPSARPGGSVLVPVRVRTRSFGVLRVRFALRVEGGGGGRGIAWGGAASFPGLTGAERLRRLDVAPVRGALLARDGSPLDQLTSAENLLGSVGRAHGALLARMRAEGFPASTPVGLDGLELLFQSRLGGRPGAVLYAGARRLASMPARRGADVRTSLSPALQTLAVQQLGTGLGGAVAMDPATGEILAAAGAPLTDLQPPGSTFKIVTVTGVLEAGLATPATTFPDATSTVLDGYRLHNYRNESCGGTLANAFAVSCNSVYAPLGARLGARRLLAAAETYGFNRPFPMPIATESTIPPGSLQSSIDDGASAIGQGQVLASPLQMLRVAGTIALVGRRPVPTFATGPARLFPRVVPVGVAREIRAMMVDVVRYGTGTAAAIPGVTVAAKTGTAQVPAPCASTSPTGAGGASGTSGGKHCPSTASDAWFVAFAPEIHPRVVVSVLVPYAGVGGVAAAPIARALIVRVLAGGV